MKAPQHPQTSYNNQHAPTSPRELTLSSRHNQTQGVLDMVLSLPLFTLGGVTLLFLASGSPSRNDGCVVSIPNKEAHDKRS